jgi:site-specific recombinase XerD
MCIRLIQILLDHKKLDTTARYAHVAIANARRAGTPSKQTFLRLMWAIRRKLIATEGQ